MSLGVMQELPPNERIGVLGGPVHPHGDASAEFGCILRIAWKVFHSCKRLWSVPGRLASKRRVLHSSMILGMALASGTCFWMKWELQQLRARWCPTGAETPHRMRTRPREP